MTTPTVEVVVKNVADLGEGPVWDPATQSLWLVDISQGQIINWDSQTDQIKRIDMGGQCGFAIPTESGQLIAAKDQSIVKVDPATGQINVITTVEQDLATRFNDAKVDASGRLWAGTMGLPVNGNIPPSLGSLYSMGSDLTIKKVLGELSTDRLSISNGIGWNAANTEMYFVDSAPKKVFAFNFDLQQGTISNQRIALNYNTHVPQQSRGIPDGLCVDTEDKVWVATFYGSHVYRFDPQNGQILQEVKLPAINITSVCFGGKDLDELYVTSSKYDSPDPANDPLGGSLFRVRGLGVKGRPANFFKG